MRQHLWILIFVPLFWHLDLVAAKKDYKGLFGSYRRDRFTENEANSSDFGVDISLSTLFPITTVVESREAVDALSAPMNYATFFNFETTLSYSMAYYWELFLNIGYYNYDTRKENTIFKQDDKPLFHEFEMTIYPAVGGIKYRFSTDDIVPYVGVGFGVSYVRRRGSYDYSPAQFDLQHLTVLTGEIMGGFQFYFTPRAGLRIEVSAFYIQLPERIFDPGTIGTLPTLTYKASPISIRYASGLFFLF